MAHWLGSQGDRVGHDIGIECCHPSDFIASFSNGMSGTCETGAMLGWRLLRHYIPDVRIAVVRRPRGEVLYSLSKFGLAGLEAEMERRDAMLDLIGSLPGTLSLDWRGLGNPEGAGALFEFCLGKQFDLEIWREMDQINIQVDMQARLEQLRRNYPKLEALKAEIIAQQVQLFRGTPCPILH